MSEILNVALVGHVANGKTTLVEALTRVNTKRSSAEKKSGRTIKLGYANCILWKCDKCTHVESSGQSESEMTCANCGVSMRLVKKISFVDAPGHHSYVHTMIKGATIVDAAILVTDVRHEPMQVQTTEHLAILSILGVENIIVVQNKADLVNSERCLAHYIELKHSLQRTSAENSVIIPISAQNDINLNVLRSCLLALVEKLEYSAAETRPGIFNIIRSFDVNRPGISPASMKGGVLGGTVVGNGKFTVGDIVEIRPGFILRGEAYSIRTQIETIFSENIRQNETAIGGLFGIGTKLDPTYTKSDLLAGSLMGPPGSLPLVVRELEMRITNVKLNDAFPKEKVRDGIMYKLIIGNVVVGAIACQTKKGFMMLLDRPICSVESRCLIYTQESSNTRMIAFGTILINEPFRRIAARVPINQPDYAAMIADLSFLEKSKKKIPVVRVIRENRNIIWLNIQQVADAIYRPVIIIQKYLQDETLFNASMSAGGLRIYKSNINGPRIETILRRYIKDSVLCKQCMSLNTSAVKCMDCDASV